MVKLCWYQIDLEDIEADPTVGTNTVLIYVHAICPVSMSKSNTRASISLTWKIAHHKGPIFLKYSAKRIFPPQDFFIFHIKMCLYLQFPIEGRDPPPAKTNTMAKGAQILPACWATSTGPWNQTETSKVSSSTGTVRKPFFEKSYVPWQWEPDTRKLRP